MSDWFEVGKLVKYRDEIGEITRNDGGEYIFVRYRGDNHSKSTRRADLRIVCHQCKIPVTQDRKCYATPMCHACLPPPRTL